MIISFDTETTGLDLVHGATPFLATSCDDKGMVRFWEWEVNPLTRQPSIPQEDITQIAKLLDDVELIYLHNSQFDARVIAKLGLELPWHKVRDSFIAGHLLETNTPHNLTDMCTIWIGKNIHKYELDAKQAVTECRKIVKKQLPKWRLANEGEPDMPSISPTSKRDEDKPWKNDMWLPRALALELDLPLLDPSCNHLFFQLEHTNKKCTKCGGHFWFYVTPKYANMDSISTIQLGPECERQIQKRGYWPHYLHRLQLMKADCEMVSYGVTVIGNYTEDTIQHYTEFVSEANNALVEIADTYGHELELASGASINNNMRDFFYGAEHQQCYVCGYIKRVKHWNGESLSQEGCPKCAKGSKRKPSRYSVLHTHTQQNLGLHVIESKKTGNACLDKDAMQEYLGTLDGEARQFIKILMDKRKHETDLTYMEAYKRFWVPVIQDGTIVPGYHRIHPSINPCGTDHLRQSSNSPNLQNVGGQEDKCEDCDGDGCDICNFTGKSRVSVKNCFGPAPGREWYCMDYRQIERRIPPYECGEEKMIAVFEKENEPPFWGNLYLLTASVLYPIEFWPCANEPLDSPNGFRGLHKRLYKQAKFFDLAKQYSCGRIKGDMLSKVTNSFDLVDNEFPNLAKLQRHYIREAELTGYVQTLPSRAIDGSKGYPILASRTEDNYILSTTPFNYHNSGTACECKNLALIRCINKCAEWRREGFDAHICLEIHDELIADFPKGPNEDSNLWRAMELKKLMEQSGEDLIPRIPTPVKVEYCPRTWAEGKAV